MPQIWFGRLALGFAFNGVLQALSFVFLLTRRFYGNPRKDAEL
jgi:hypothetical protein